MKRTGFLFNYFKKLKYNSPPFLAHKIFVKLGVKLPEK